MRQRRKRHVFNVHKQEWNYLHWVHTIFEHVQIFHTDLLQLHAREEHCSNWLSSSLPEWPGMTKNDHPYKLEWSIRARTAVDSAKWDLDITTKLIPTCKHPCMPLLKYTIMFHFHLNLNCDHGDILACFQTK